MARVALAIPDLLFGSNAQGLLEAGGHQVVAASEGAEVLVVDLTLPPASADPGSVPVPDGAVRLGVFAHVEPEVRERAQAAGYELVVPRSRFMREGPALVAGLASG